MPCALIADRGMPTATHIREYLEPAGLDRVSAPKGGDLRRPLEAPTPPPENPDAGIQTVLRATVEIPEGVAARSRRENQPLRGRGAINRIPRAPGTGAVRRGPCCGRCSSGGLRGDCARMSPQ